MPRRGVFVDRARRPALRAPADARTAVMDQVNKEFVPHVLPVAVGTEVSFPNHDQIHHHVYSFSRTKTFEIPLYKGEAAPPVRFDQVGAVKLGCNIHDWMSGVILVVPTPYFAMTDEQRRLRAARPAAGHVRRRRLARGQQGRGRGHARRRWRPATRRRR